MPVTILFEVDLNYFIPQDLKNKENFNENAEFEKMNRILKELYKTKNADIILAAENCLNSLHAILKKRNK
ncbi:MAG: hypothetical protein M1276_07250 [Deltaproteobacteria bacterium]|nr:hypothetical protein [Deltaproteobacteria bacterium]